MPKTFVGIITREYLEKYSKASTNAIARMLHKDYPTDFKTFENARAAVRYYRNEKKSKPKVGVSVRSEQTKIIEVFNNLLGSLKTDKGGYSARKLTSLVLIACVVFAHYMIFRNENALEVFENVILYDFGMVAVLLGLIDASDLIKHGRENKKKNENDKLSP